MSFLPPDIILACENLGIEPVNIESTGALRFRIDNSMSISRKTACISSFKKALKEYGLDLSRSVTDMTPEWDMSLLMIKRDADGYTIPLFQKNGKPHPEPSHPTGPFQAARHQPL